jgi:hypothetical protein
MQTKLQHLGNSNATKKGGLATISDLSRQKPSVEGKSMRTKKFATWEANVCSTSQEPLRHFKKIATNKVIIPSHFEVRTKTSMGL